MHFKIIHEISLGIKFIFSLAFFFFCSWKLIYSNRNVENEGGNLRIAPSRERLKHCSQCRKNREREREWEKESRQQRHATVSYRQKLISVLVSFVTCRSTQNNAIEQRNCNSNLIFIFIFSLNNGLHGMFGFDLYEYDENGKINHNLILDRHFDANEFALNLD